MVKPTLSVERHCSESSCFGCCLYDQWMSSITTNFHEKGFESSNCSTATGTAIRRISFQGTLPYQTLDFTQDRQQPCTMKNKRNSFLQSQRPFVFRFTATFAL
ncbi:hypothetical protein TGPRC2_255175 [Toxoplasma gondii TgCatPRC2]|uniref:Uncharacterized protein n=14 Tax=Toxoplasma gondii TaxID=5811 RepID=A0A125YJW9_TOXGV|nr:hypothetical protein TGME49_255175 [Toxoplasma gondii ME49]EPR64010.1 hypothetical protein TGGT1_255175 [Toxoplasma gondii GT1]ESS35471.1 hypothetical protein TGVEG_255175 [Toxoplasma gondii VEG]KFG30080.1 hypothetical protein TGDOM2_255175 [Toxoplasma gondii GAB2-2007-GAL-DOM2]KFG36945.1 hypothetical protein TGFOU_255175 [Toxoplasma gondii FOU]KFG50594.1 hypothetical protein TGP89_255175 [Toxoplasma gondii p89]KFG57542.1 hypothetical protein TGRUB_255175 [Toxoplasma gondii RUB]KFH02764.1|eukprot:XP_018636923.1 hypothetical protein TGME49_255175 [Toxoplasma gondii ME49]